MMKSILPPYCLLALAFTMLVTTSASSPAQLGKEKLSGAPSLPPEVSTQVKPMIEAYLKIRTQQITELASKYKPAIEDQINRAADSGDLKTARAFQEEKKGVEALIQTLSAEAGDPFVAAQRSDTLPSLSPDTPKPVVGLREIWTGERQKIRAKLDGDLQRSLKSLQVKLTKARNLDNAEKLLAYRESLLSNSPIKADTETSPQGTPPSPGMDRFSATASATKEDPYKNSLGMPFVPVPITGGPTDGQRVLFCVWETRVKDYRDFLRKDRNRFWQEPEFKQKRDHPVVNVSWNDAVAFCAWLTAKEREEGLIENSQAYRLPSDHEWSCAVGIGSDEDADAPPASKMNGLPGVYPWGSVFPPPKGAGNYYGEEVKNDLLGDNKPIPGYDDGFEFTSPVGSFEANAFGLYDMGGNVREWCGDPFSPEDPDRRIARDAAWSLFLGKKHLKSAFRSPNPPAFSHFSYGFRIVLTAQ